MVRGSFTSFPMASNVRRWLCMNSLGCDTGPACPLRRTRAEGGSHAAPVCLRDRRSADRQAPLEKAIRQTAAGGSTALYNAVYIALKDLNKTVLDETLAHSRRRAIVILSDGEDTSSLVAYDEVLGLAARSDVAIYAIGLLG